LPLLFEFVPFEVLYCATRYSFHKSRGTNSKIVPMRGFDYGRSSVEDSESSSALPRRAQMNHQLLPSTLKDSASHSTLRNPETLLAYNKRQQPSRDQWESLKPLIHHLYIKENRGFSYVAGILRDEHEFFPTYDNHYVDGSLQTAYLLQETPIHAENG
jgi:hypothetical protein